MTTLKSVSGAHGDKLGRCDANCYDAKHPHCDCICGGKNHGVGKKQAMENTFEISQELIKNLPPDCQKKISINPEARQMDFKF
ncbi:MAG: hypothetical protein PHV68_10450 [Candidatus Gastranaerophilales bacterium]|nr:hypothetical protein [Candidatus Gastranaerophilales bacterium]